MQQVFITFYIIAIGIGVFLGVMRGTFYPFPFGHWFFLRLFLYCPAHPIRLPRSWGDCPASLFWSGIGLGSLLCPDPKISWEAFWGTLPFGIMLFSMITINEIPDYFEDRKGGKLNLVARFGRETGVWLFILSLLSAYGAILTGVILGRIPLLGLISLLTLPIALQDHFHFKKLTIRIQSRWLLPIWE